MQYDGAYWSKRDKPRMEYYQQSQLQRLSPVFHRDPNSNQGHTWRSNNHHQCHPPPPPPLHVHQNPPLQHVPPPYTYYHHPHHLHHPHYYSATAPHPPPPPAAVPPPIYDSPGPLLSHNYDDIMSNRGSSGSSPTPSLVYVHPSSSDSQQHVPASDLIYEIRQADVLCGRGAPSHHHVGNQEFRALVQQFQSSYLAARRVHKPDIAMRIVSIVHSRGGRFLKRCKVEGVGPCGHFCWQDIGEQRAYEKACQALREGAPDVRRQLAAKEVAAAALALDGMGWYNETRDEDGVRDGVGGGDHDVERE